MSEGAKQPSPYWLSVNAVALILDLHPHTVKRLPVDELPYWTANTRGDRKYAQEDVAAYVAKRYRGRPASLTIGGYEGDPG